MGDSGGGPQSTVEAFTKRKAATQKQQQKELQQKSLQALKRRKTSFAGNLPTSLFTNGDNTLG